MLRGCCHIKSLSADIRSGRTDESEDELLARLKAEQSMNRRDHETTSSNTTSAWIEATAQDSSDVDQFPAAVPGPDVGQLQRRLQEDSIVQKYIAETPATEAECERGWELWPQSFGSIVPDDLLRAMHRAWYHTYCTICIIRACSIE